ncbi:hypothetical protein [Vibrio viridaestus]|uniref:Lipoprotein n=1 Tax=Vibrio viridaestus TaxID=2487322 RepID=A0A3N9TIQ2_9VIBR|nr:hypothetical protein [Vibrio viridaestus]RQW63980.1 hypothetical protein EES38_05080 [Vibrio viridaestus]
MTQNKKLKLKNTLYLFFVASLLIFLQGCSANQKNELRRIAQTSSASEIYKYKIAVLDDLKKYKRKLDLRNPYSYNPELREKIFKEIETGKNTINLYQAGKELTHENEYLHYAFLPENIQYRNDFLILGLYKLVYKAYDLSTSHKFTAIEYNSTYMQELYKYLQVVRWKIRTNKGNDGQYLFLTWQNNWQIELMNHPATDLNIIRDLSFIKDKRETLFDHSNFSFEILMNRMLINVKYSLEETNIEPYDMSVSALKTFVFII